MKGTVLPAGLEFDWDEGNTTKSWIKHRVSAKEQEEAFLVEDKLVLKLSMKLQIIMLRKILKLAHIL